MKKTNEMKVFVTRNPGTKEEAEISIGKLTRVCGWTREVHVGDVHRYLDYYVLKAQMFHASARELEIASDLHADVAVLANVYLMEAPNQKEEYKEGYKYLCELVGPRRRVSIGRPKGQPPCTKKVLEVLSEKSMTRAEVRKALLAVGYDADTITHTIKRLEKTGRITIQPHSNPQKQVLCKATEN